MGKFYGRVKIEMACSFLYYKKGTATQNILHNLKYNNHPEISYFLGNLYAQQLKETTILDTVDEIIAVPLHKSKQRKRGYNQVEGFAKALADNFHIPINEKLLIKSKRGKSQAKKGLFDRLKTKEAEFVLCPKADKQAKHFLLLDDILTTGSTLEKCAKQLLNIPHSKVTILCLAMSTKSF
ncbi:MULTISPECIES: ComF family protein [Myroides]|uniref:ComF family protein n=1 Tax=Myroides albus TaxID=2562892 RepID=A0A6I3LJZ1_9FLAO|nr:MULTISPECIES: phosphoribosyltransferase family protein [Myroides]MTG97530.1 ComF family protein [Myroides albus]MVX35054.1 ComF family protein [Myroides sp. LoEW2-1]